MSKPEPGSGKTRNVHKANSGAHSLEGRRPAAAKTQVAKSNAAGPSSGASAKKPAPSAKTVAATKGSYKAAYGKASTVTVFGHTFDKKQFYIAIAIGVLGVLLVICILLAVFSPLFKKSAAPAVSASAPAAQASSSANYDKDAHKIDTTLLDTTVLGLTEDAGPEYVTETLFIGDSNTARMPEYNSVTGVTLQNSIGIEGMGIQSVQYNTDVIFQGYSHRVSIPAAVTLMQPRRIVITFGTNNAGYNNVDSFIDSYATVLDAIHEAYTYADIIIGAVPPIAQGTSYGVVNMEAIDAYNAALAELADKEGYKFLNWTEALKDKNTGYIKAGYTVADGIHLNELAMKAMFDYFRTHSHIVEDTRPMPLNPIPWHLPTPSIAPSSSSAAAYSSSSSSSSESSSSEESAVVPSEPVESSSTPEESSSAPAESSSTPVESSSTPVESSSTPAESSTTPTEDAGDGDIIVTSDPGPAAAPEQPASSK